MRSDQDSQEEYLPWIEVQKKATEIWIAGDVAVAIGLINRYLKEAPSIDLRRRALAFRGDLYEDCGNLEAAKADLSSAHKLSNQPDYERYTIELSLGSIAEALGDPEAADSWYLQALETASVDATTSGGSAIRRLLKLRGERMLAEDERHLAERVIRQGWHLLSVEGEPDFQDLKGTARKLIEAQSRPPRDL